MKTKSNSSLMSLVTFVFGATFAVAGLSGCDTEAFCWDCGTSSSSGDAAAGGNGGAGGLFPTGGGGEGGCIFGCNTGGAGGCTPTNGGIEVCDNLDNDCDGTTDVGPMIDFSSIQRCGTCANNCFTQLINCEVSSIKCTPSTRPGIEPGVCQCDMCAQDYYDLDNNETCEYYCVKGSDVDNVCNNKDDNCNGVKDEDVDLCTSTTDCGKCGRNCVTIHGTSQCVNDGTMPCTDANTQCQILQCDCTGPGNCFWDLDNSYATGCEYQCDITNNGVELCDGLDNDCDGKIDAADDLSMDMTIGAVCYGDPDGECATAIHAGTTECQGGMAVCVGSGLLVENQTLETCNGLDDDCDGTPDDAPTDIGRSCGASNVAPCAFGVTQCQMAQIVCVGNIDPAMEVCDGVDNNCNGMIDDAAQGTGVSCGQSGTAPCMLGMIQCVGGSLQCMGARNPATETCNGVDDDCNGTVDDNISGVGAQCGQSGTAPCTFGTMQCQNGQTICVGAVNPTPETCDGIDNNCDGTVDNQAQGTGVSCGQSNTFPCSFGTIQCQSGNLVCIGALNPQTETCDGQDNDCNGVIDNSPVGAGTQCGTTDTGACAYGTYQCQTGSLVCVGAINAQPETCNGVDDDCNGVIDNNATGVGVQCGQTNVGPCEYGMQQCQNGTLVCVGAINPGTETCNGIDDNCDGLIDNNTTDATGTCGASNIFPCSYGTKQCQSGAIVCVGAINPGTETCNGIDDDCDGTIDRTGGQPPTDSTGQCNVPPPPPMGATSPCRAGTKSCTGGSVQCNGSVGPTSTTDTCGVDANCDGALTNQPNLQTDVANCGSCGNNCYAGAVHSNWSCVSGMCQFQGCQSGYYDLNNDNQCEYACTYISATEACNAVDDNCNGSVDEMVPRPSPVQLCGVSPSATRPECTTGITLTCTSGSWVCGFPAGVCTGGCSSDDETCDALDNDCDGLLNENVPNFGQPCASDDANPNPGDGACRRTGTYACTSGTTTACNATRASCTSNPGGCTEQCDGVDNDCDGLIDEIYNNKGTDTANFVRPAVTKVVVGTFPAIAIWVYSYEASRPLATTSNPGSGNGYWTSAPSGTTLDKTRACSLPSKVPWFNVTPVEVTQTCTAMGGDMCSAATFTAACQAQATPVCTWGYNPRGTACTSGYVTGSKFCNLGPSFDFNQNAADGDQDGLLPTASSLLSNCWADWSNLQGNLPPTDRIYDMTGNLREIVFKVSGDYRLMGGAYNSGADTGATCSFDFYSANATFKFPDTGFRCCFGADPTL